MNTFTNALPPNPHDAEFRYVAVCRKTGDIWGPLNYSQIAGPYGAQWRNRTMGRDYVWAERTPGMVARLLAQDQPAPKPMPPPTEQYEVIGRLRSPFSGEEREIYWKKTLADTHGK